MDTNTIDEKNEKDEEIIISSDELLITLNKFINMYQRSLYKARAHYTPYRGQVRLLNIIAQNDGLIQKELTEILDIRSATLSELLDKLERSNLIKRTKDEVDKRKMRVFLTSEGLDFLKKFENQNDISEQVFETLSSEEKYSFYNTIKKLCTHFEAQAILEDYDLNEPLPPHMREHIPPHERDGHPPKPPHHHK
ncbi:DNA-binding MarR family transcriptional regulator [Clostridium saccharoperbutylacetonicum]|uniref:Putative MarR-like transcriptional regulator n=1 Tax=Clostridium saccharoperbutylacetonicum N1-4(HMT) TaxID=931276 RepID=M1MD40_9CLOT|nr:MarR family transcriptional regulator [Clostridium saccharoperbutylacetonicum]AGF55824.1 putative MarR-like transcriptional regulator [Clostridium saccharoperbutylacetonicum N1-4(HMT)]NRT63442.1 DNA-binding MarR family transcriptional regulator [Clostridium saccharoperbutylacetonicum]NSB26804.1 DNA-binding MarR family transcriptional regulator [Clostridium saccharoperbutylacetonicum]NSB40283.1 DNA-binding MarR family transcriptional regulator [Clostridium saccharoperbutylacetonicum]